MLKQQMHEAEACMLVQRFAPRGSLVGDDHAGSSTVMRACARTGRKCVSSDEDKTILEAGRIETIHYLLWMHMKDLLPKPGVPIKGPTHTEVRGYWKEEYLQLLSVGGALEKLDSGSQLPATKCFVPGFSETE